MTVRVRSPRKSNFTRPTFSTPFMSNWVTSSPLVPLYSGRYSIMGRSAMTRPEAWVEACRGKPLQGLGHGENVRDRGVGVPGFPKARLLLQGLGSG